MRLENKVVVITGGNSGVGEATAKLFAKEDQERIINLTNDLILNAGSSILNGKYKIEPKRIDNKNVSCTYCKYKDVCFMNYEDELELEKKPFKEGE